MVSITEQETVKWMAEAVACHRAVTLDEQQQFTLCASFQRH